MFYYMFILIYGNINEAIAEINYWSYVVCQYWQNKMIRSKAQYRQVLFLYAYH